jgi:hypothetical protein
MTSINNKVKIIYKKISRIPRNELFFRLKIGAKKYYADYPAICSVSIVSSLITELKSAMG